MNLSLLDISIILVYLLATVIIVVHAWSLERFWDV